MELGPVELVALIGHELRQAAGAIAHQLELQSRIDLDAALLSRSRTAITAGAADLAKLSDDLNDLERVLRGEFTVHVRTVDLATLAHDSLDGTAPDARTELTTSETVAQADPALTAHILNGLNRQAISRESAATWSISVQEATIGLRVCPRGREPSPTRPVRTDDGLGLYTAGELMRLQQAELRVDDQGNGVTLVFPRPSAG